MSFINLIPHEIVLEGKSIHVDGITSLPTWAHELGSLTPEARQLLAEIVYWHLLQRGEGKDNSTLYRDYHAIMVACLVAEEGALLSSTVGSCFHAVDSDDVHRIIREALREWLSHSHGLQQSFSMVRSLLEEIDRFCGFSSGLKESLWG